MKTNKKTKLPDKEWVTLRELHGLCPGITIRTLRRWAEAGHIPVERRVDGRWIVHWPTLMGTFDEIKGDPETALEIALKPSWEDDDDEEDT